MSEKTKKKKLLPIIITAGVVLLLVGVMLLLMFLPKNTDTEEIEDTSTPLTLTVDDNGCHQASPILNDKGKLEHNGSGTLLSYNPADLKKIEIENQSGTYTVKAKTTKTTETNSSGEEEEKTDATVYTLVGYEDMALLDGKPDEIASNASSLDFTKTISVDEKDLKKFGLSSPRAEAKIYYDDKTYAIVKVGNDAPASEGTYITYGDNNTVYLVDTSSVEGFFISVLDLMDLNINTSAKDDQSASFKYIKLSGKAYDENITIRQNSNDSTSNASYLITAPYKAYASDSAVSDTEGGIRGLYATEVVCVNPSKKQMKKFGIASPYASLEAKYSDTTVYLLASKPFDGQDENGNDTEFCYLMPKGGDVIYKIDTDSVKWVNTSLNKLLSQSVVDNKLGALSSLTVDTGSKSYTFKLKTTTTTETNDDGEEETTELTTVKYNGKSLEESVFQSFYSNLSGVTKKELTDEKAKGNPILTVTYKYSGNRSTDKVEYYATDTQKVVIKVNGKPVAYNYKSYVDKVKSQVKNVLKDKQVPSIL